jgi:hypothetical protein
MIRRYTRHTPATIDIDLAANPGMELPYRVHISNYSRLVRYIYSTKKWPQYFSNRRRHDRKEDGLNLVFAFVIFIVYSYPVHMEPST